MLVTVVIAACVSVGACALWLPDRAPALLDAPAETTSAPASVQEYAGGQQVTLVPSMSQARDLLSNTSGLVTADWSAQGLSSGRGVMRVGERSVVALATATPLYRDLRTGDRGQDVLALNNELNRLGYNSAPESDVFSWATSDGWRQLMVDNGNESDGSLSLADTLWIPQESVAVGSWTAVQGAQVTAGTAVGVVPGAMTRLSIKGGQASERDRALTVAGVSVTLPAGATEITDAGFLSQVAAVPEIASLDGDQLAVGLDGTLSLAEPVEVLRVPAGAVFGIADGIGCVAPADGDSEGEPVRVSIIGGELGVSLVVPEDMAPGDISSVLLGSRLDGLTCG
ncbi:hypothetical protein BLEM_2168 [Bifidobacterium lemurum]|uniref:Peptidoglycan-binding domain 1 protein n=1 Tax=Bifidobacterium lemurum TaxID=1603886 RepID=A0A261FLZ6_9BIFI|nr:hypothetical protein [Bifidobacterium lemurum]OZG59993.1 hypothetical protein BLEM_2168 [Bifidobacterium lemurum]